MSTFGDMILKLVTKRNGFCLFYLKISSLEGALNSALTSNQPVSMCGRSLGLVNLDLAAAIAGNSGLTICCK